MTRGETWNKLVSLGIVRGAIPSERWNLPKANLHRANLKEADLYGTNLSGANLSEANLSRVDLRLAVLRSANLRSASFHEANLNSADLNSANLHGSDLSRANLISTNFYGADLSETDLTGATLIRANLTKAILNGACIDFANLSEWIIKDVVCTHLIVRKSFAERKIQFGLYEFEKKYTQMQKIAEIILNIPLTESAGFIGNFIAESINYLVQSSVISWKGVEALSDKDAKFTFNIFDNNFFDTKKEFIETALQDALNKYFKNNPMETLKENYYDPVENATNGIVTTREKISIPYTHYQVMPRVVRTKIIEHYNKLGKTGEAIFNIIRSVFK